MLCMVTFSIAPENIQDALDRFQEGEGEPPEGVEMIGRWHEVGTGNGYALYDVEDMTAFTGFIMGWADLAEQECVPVVEDADIAANL